MQFLNVWGLIWYSGLFELPSLDENLTSCHIMSWHFPEMDLARQCGYPKLGLAEDEFLMLVAKSTRVLGCISKSKFLKIPK